MAVSASSSTVQPRALRISRTLAPTNSCSRIVGKALKALSVYEIGKPIVIEEMFPLSCSIAELDQFIDGSTPRAAGWIGFYWGKTIAEYKREKPSAGESLALDWLGYFVRKTPEIQALRATRQIEGKSDR